MRKVRKVAIFGTHPAADEVPEPDGYEIWVINDGWKYRTRYDRLYELHRLEERPWRSEEHKKHIRANAEKVWTLFPDRIKGANLYPVQEVLGKYPPYFTCSPAWMMAQALHEGVSHLYLPGLHFSTAKERLLERPCMEFWIGMAKGKGVEVVLPPASTLLKGRGLYGLEDSLHNVYTELLAFAHSNMEEQYGEIGRYVRSGFHEPREP